MNLNTTSCRKDFDTTVTEDGFAPGIGRKLRSFDMDGTSPCDHPGGIALLKAQKLANLTSNQIRAFLLLHDDTDPLGCTAAEVALWLQMPVATARSCLRILKRKGYALCSSIAQECERGQKTHGWVINRANECADEEVLFWEFADLI